MHTSTALIAVAPIHGSRYTQNPAMDEKFNSPPCLNDFLFFYFFIIQQRTLELNEFDSNGFAPVHYAAKFNHFEIMKNLIEAGKFKEGQDNNELGCRPGKKNSFFSIQC